MFYYIVSKIPFISNTESKTIKVFVLGSIIYILLHAYINSASNANSEFLNAYGKYLYYLWALDVAIVGMSGTLSNATSTGKIEDDSDNNTKMSKEEIKHKLDEIKMLPEQPPNYPFVRKSDNQQPPNDQSSNTDKEEPKEEPKEDPKELQKKTEMSDTEIELYKK